MEFDSGPTTIVQTSLVSSFEDNLPVDDALATLTRADYGVDLTLNTELDPGAYTVWWVIFNNPEFCEGDCDADDLDTPSVDASIFWATGEVVGDDGIGEFSALLPEGVIPDGPDQVALLGDGNGLKDAFSAEIHNIVRSHGLVLPELEEEQITTLNAGCPPNECEDVQFAVFPSVAVPEPQLIEVFGSLDTDVIEVTGSKQLVFAGEGDDLIDASIASQGGNRIYGGSGNDTSILGVGDRLVGAEGADRFFVTNSGDNIITGGEGADQYWVAVATIPDTANIITDFSLDEDVIGIAGLDVGFEDISITSMEGDALIAVNDSQLAILQGIDSTSLSANNFAFV